MRESEGKSCLACRRDEGKVPLLRLEYQRKTFWICPQHLPVLIHDPASLVGKLPGAEQLSPAEHKD
jgi:hypothetical protein